MSKVCQNPREVLENTLWAKSCATPFSEPVTLLNHSAPFHRGLFSKGAGTSTTDRPHWWTGWAPAWGYIPATGAGEEDTL